ncbi:MAG: pantoate--beta-alanine ligase [Phycisphaeraceae bacterium]|nr:pantoate--beta-alanine ligase [Phycisphaeraceae bacterium]
MQITESIDRTRAVVCAAREQGKRIGLVPTMGALHVGHTSLIEAAKACCDFVVVSVFVNPTQFGPAEDIANYPRPLEHDCTLCKEQGVDLVFTPTSETMYGRSEPLTWVTVEQMTDYLCGESRPGHFRGVTTVCTKLFNIVQPDIAFFGQKDAQQVLVIQRMVTDLNMPLTIQICPTARESDGLAMSSRNKYLTPDQRKQATCLYRALQTCRTLIKQGVLDAEPLVAAMTAILNEVPHGGIDYISISDVQTLEPLACIQDKALVALALHMGSARLIDNILVDVSES